ncbi:MAG: phosphoribosyl-AMP cyclohydrolase [Verrucomicrobia bacterium]|jgi:phosphoribosyl-AMP cyclohydrolase|nr:phosphoribosyl-AMP cyclohydrolase [Verrucomicrobiota bacterium]
MKSQHPAKKGGEETFVPKFDAQGLLTAIVVESSTGKILMVAHMNREALEATRKNRKATFFSRSRKKIWVKGETSGNFMEVQEILVDCDQDCVLLRVRLPAGGVACHTGAKSCFFRRWKPDEDGTLEILPD